MKPYETCKRVRTEMEPSAIFHATLVGHYILTLEISHTHGIYIINIICITSMIFSRIYRNIKHTKMPIGSFSHKNIK